jgi:hypothetical protein
VLVFHNFHSTTIFLIPHPPCKYPNARYNLRTYSYELFFRMSRKTNPPPGVRKFIHRYMLQMLRQTVEVKLQVMLALCMTRRHIGELKSFSNHLQFRNYMGASGQNRRRTTPTNMTLAESHSRTDAWRKTEM